MKFLVSQFSNALYFITLGWKNALTPCEWQPWDRKVKSTFDAFSEFEPDVFIGHSTEIDRALTKCVKARPKMKVVLKAGNFGPINEKIDPEEYPIHLADQEEFKKVADFVDAVGSDRVVLFNFYHPKRMEETMGFWREQGIPTISQQPAADVTLYYPEDMDVDLHCDVAFVGGYWPYKARQIDPYLLPLCHPVGKYNIKIFGNQPWPVPQYMGTCAIDMERALYNAATVCVNISEPHANKFGFELNERVFKLSACKAFWISDPVTTLTEDVFRDHKAIIADTPEDFHHLIDKYTVTGLFQMAEHERLHTMLDVANYCYRTVVNNHTYYHRMIALMQVLGLDEKAGQVNEVYTEWLKKWDIR